MDTNSFRTLFAMAIPVLFATASSAAEERLWTDASGKFSVTAELVRVDGDYVVLRRSGGKEIKVAIGRLSGTDQAYMASLPADVAPPTTDSVNEIIAKIAADFYADLRTEDRQTARHTLTKKAADLITGKQSPLTGLPQPAAGMNAVNRVR
jgi:hypothetical protein